MRCSCRLELQGRLFKQNNNISSVIDTKNGLRKSFQFLDIKHDRLASFLLIYQSFNSQKILPKEVRIRLRHSVSYRNPDVIAELGALTSEVQSPLQIVKCKDMWNIKILQCLTQTGQTFSPLWFSQVPYDPLASVLCRGGIWGKGERLDPTVQRVRGTF